MESCGAEQYRNVTRPMAVGQPAAGVITWPGAAVFWSGHPSLLAVVAGAARLPEGPWRRTGGGWGARRAHHPLRQTRSPPHAPPHPFLQIAQCMFKTYLASPALALSFTAAAPAATHGGGPAHPSWRHPAHAETTLPEPKATVIPLAAGMAGCRYFRTVVQMGERKSSSVGNRLPTRG